MGSDPFHVEYDVSFRETSGPKVHLQHSKRGYTGTSSDPSVQSMEAPKAKASYERAFQFQRL
jgi:hypothetical protein